MTALCRVGQVPTAAPRTFTTSSSHRPEHSYPYIRRCSIALSVCCPPAQLEKVTHSESQMSLRVIHLRWSVFPQASHSNATKDISTQAGRCPSILPPARCLRVLPSMSPPYEILDALPAGGLLPELEQWLPPDKTLGAYLLGTFVGAMYVG